MTTLIKKILFLAANPKDTSRLRLSEEIREIDKGLRRSQQREYFLLEQRWATQPKDVRQALLDSKPLVVHFSGHGTIDGGLLLETAIGETQVVKPEALAALFELFVDDVECVLLNSCYSEIQAQAISQHINYVIGMSQEIGDKAAIEFAIGFYDALGAGQPIEMAYKFGCSAIQLENIPEHLTPILKQKASLKVLPYNQKKKQLVVILTTTIDEIDRPLIEAMAEHLKKISGDVSLTLKGVEPGSIKLIFDGSEEGFKRIESLFRSGQLTELSGITIKDLQYKLVDADISEDENSKISSDRQEKIFSLPSLTDQLANRDYTVIIDKSGSMTNKDLDLSGEKSRWEIIQESILALVMTCENFSQDGITVYLFSSRFHRYENVTSRRLKQIFQQNEPIGTTDLAGVLKHALDNYFQRKSSAQTKPNGETILVITDGEPDDRKAVMKVIIEASRQMDRDEELAISFIQVGTDAQATRFLRVLDDELQSAGAKFDICSIFTMDDIEENMNLSEVLLDRLYR